MSKAYPRYYTSIERFLALPVCWSNGLLILALLSPSSARCDDTEVAKAIRFVKERGGSVKRDTNMPGQPIVEVDLAKATITNPEMQCLRSFSHLRRLVLGKDTGDAELEIIRAFPEIQSLRLNMTKITDAGLLHLKRAKQLAKLELGGVEAITDTGLKQLADLANLEELYLTTDRQLTDEGVIYLRTLKKLRVLDLYDVKISDKGLISLSQNNCALQELYIGDAAMTDVGLQAISQLTGLKTLHMIGESIRVTHEGWGRIETLRNLEDLSIGFASITDADLIHIGTLKKLRRLSLSFCNVTSAGLRHLKGLDKLRVLDLSSTAVGDRGLAHIKDLVGLEELVLKNTRVTDAGLVYLRQLRNLRELDLSDPADFFDGAFEELLEALDPAEKPRKKKARTIPKITDDGLRNLSNCVRLERLFLDSQSITGVGFSHLHGLAKLRFLSLEKTNVSDDGLSKIIGVPNLQMLYLNGTKITDAGLRLLHRASRLGFVDISFNSITKEGVAKLKEKRPRLDIVIIDEDYLKSASAVRQQ